MTSPTAEQQLKFLTNLQRLLAEGQFVATYKYALLLALADIAIEFGENSDKPLTISTKLIAENFILYYLREVVPYLPKKQPTAGRVLRQNTGRQAAIIQQVFEARQRYGNSLAAAQRDKSAWNALVRNVDQVVRQMPLWKLQTVGESSFDFLYENRGEATSIKLRPGVAYCLRQLYGLIGDLVRGAWLRYVRSTIMMPLAPRPISPSSCSAAKGPIWVSCGIFWKIYSPAGAFGSLDLSIHHPRLRATITVLSSKSRMENFTSYPAFR